MIDINEYNRKDIIASCLLEAVDIMKEQEEYDNELLYEDELYESAGRNGVAGRLYDSRIKNLEKRIDRINRSDSYDDNLKNKKLERLKNEVDTEKWNKKSWEKNKKFGRQAAKYYGRERDGEYFPDSYRDLNKIIGDSYKETGERVAKYSKNLSDGHPYHRNHHNNPVIDKYDRSNRKVHPIHNIINLYSKPLDL